MSRKKGDKDLAPRAPGGGRKLIESYADKYAADPDGTTLIRLPNSTLEYFERQAKAQGQTVTQFLNAMEIASRIF